MAQYIDKDALVAEIERRMQCYSSKGCEPNDGKWVELISIKHFINTLEVKEVDINKEINRELETRWRGEYLSTPKFRESAKHFFELGLKAQKRII